MATSTLKAYRVINPNIESFIYFTTPAQYESHFGQYLEKTLTLDNYRINENIIKIKDIDTRRYDYTYFIEKITDDNNNILYWRCYNVKNVSSQSGYAIYEVKVDLWATYLYKANINYFYVNRCNRLIDIPIFDNIRATTGEEVELNVDSDEEQGGIATPEYLNTYRYIENYYLVMVINYNAKQTLFGDNQASTTRVFGIKLSDIRNAYISDIPAEPQREDYQTEEAYRQAHTQWENGLSDLEYYLYFNISAVEMARDFAGGIYAINASLTKNDAMVVNAYIIDKAFISESGVYTSFNSISLLLNGSEKSITTAILEHSDIPAKPLYIRSLNLNREVYVGLNHGGLKLNRVINEDHAIVYIRVCIGASSVNVVISQGDNQEEITSAFELIITNNVSQDTMLRHIAKAITRTDKTYSRVNKGIENGATMGPVGAVLGGIGGGLSSMASMVADFSIDKSIRGSGDALFSYGGYKDYVRIPYKAIAYESVDDEEKHVRVNGATFSCLTTLGDIFDYALMGTGGLSQQSTFVRANCIVTGIPQDAIEYIKNALQTGIYIIKA